jgi:uncharacterized membrane protein YkgB
VLPQVAVVDSFLLTLVACTTLSFVVTRPEAWVPALGDCAHGPPFLSSVESLVINDAIAAGAAVITPGGICEGVIRDVGR